jgi:hypothetical protein
LEVTGKSRQARQAAGSGPLDAPRCGEIRAKEKKDWSDVPPAERCDAPRPLA